MAADDKNPLGGLISASQDRDAKAVSSLWRGLTPAEQEAVVLELLGVDAGADHDEATAEIAAIPSIDPSVDPMEDTAAMAPAGDTEVIPKVVDDLRSLTAAASDHPIDHVGLPDDSAAPPNRYWSRWTRRWKVSALVAAWAVTTVFAFTTDTTSFGPTEWLVSIVGSVVLGGVLVGTLVNFAVAALPEPARRRGEP